MKAIDFFLANEFFKNLAPERTRQCLSYNYALQLANHSSLWSPQREIYSCPSERERDIEYFCYRTYGQSAMLASLYKMERMID